MAFIVEAFDFKIEEVSKEHECVNQGADKEHKQINQAVNVKHENNNREAIDRHEKNNQGGNKEYKKREHNIQEANEEHEGLLEENECELFIMCYVKINCLHSQKSDIKQGNICSVKFAIFNYASDIQYKFLNRH